MRLLASIGLMAVVLVAACGGSDTSDLDEQIMMLDREVSQLQDENRDLTDQIDTLAGANEDLAAQSDISESELERIRGELGDLESERDQLVEALAEALGAPTPEERRFLATARGLLFELETAINGMKAAFLNNGLGDTNDALSIFEQPWTEQYLNALVQYEQASIQLTALSGPSSVQTIRELCQRIASMVDDERERILLVTVPTDVLIEAGIVPFALSRLITNTIELVDEF